MAKLTFTVELRHFIEARAYGCCEYCLSQQRFATHFFSIDHIIPPNAGGTDASENLALCCQGCNNFKYNKTQTIDFKTNKIVPLFHPRRYVWNEHFKWNETFTVLIGLSETGRATIAALKLNRESLLNQRAMYRAYGVHPPNFS